MWAIVLFYLSVVCILSNFSPFFLNKKFLVAYLTWMLIWYFLQDHHHDITEILLKVALNTSLFKIVFLYLPEIQDGWQNRTYYNIRPNEFFFIYFCFLINAWKCLLSSITKHTHVITACTTFLYCFIKASFSSYHQHQIEKWIYCCHYFEGRFFRLLITPLVSSSVSYHVLFYMKHVPHSHPLQSHWIIKSPEQRLETYCFCSVSY